MMTDKDMWLALVMSVLSICLVASGDIAGDYGQPSYRSASADDVVSKPVRDDGLGSLLLKNLRFRDLEKDYEGWPVSNAILRELHKLRELQRAGSGLTNQQIERKVEKRQSVSVSQLAELLHSLKTRGIEDDGVKLQSLRFGK